MRRPGRPIIKKVPFNPKKYEAVLKARNTSTIKLCEKINISRKTIERAKKSKTINPITLNEIGVELDVDPYWIEEIEEKSDQCINAKDFFDDVKWHPYSHSHNVYFDERFYTILDIYNLPKDKVNTLSDEEINGLRMELDTAITMALLRVFFHKDAVKGSPFWNNRKLYQLAVEVQNSVPYDTFFKLTQS